MHHQKWDDRIKSEPKSRPRLCLARFVKTVQSPADYLQGGSSAAWTQWVTIIVFLSDRLQVRTLYSSAVLFPIKYSFKYSFNPPLFQKLIFLVANLNSCNIFGEICIFFCYSWRVILRVAYRHAIHSVNGKVWSSEWRLALCGVDAGGWGGGWMWKAEREKHHLNHSRRRSTVLYSDCFKSEESERLKKVFLRTFRGAKRRLVQGIVGGDRGAGGVMRFCSFLSDTEHTANAYDTHNTHGLHAFTSVERQTILSDSTQSQSRLTPRPRRAAAAIFYSGRYTNTLSSGWQFLKTCLLAQPEVDLPIAAKEPWAGQEARAEMTQL